MVRPNTVEPPTTDEIAALRALDGLLHALRAQLDRDELDQADLQTTARMLLVAAEGLQRAHLLLPRPKPAPKELLDLIEDLVATPLPGQTPPCSPAMSRMLGSAGLTIPMAPLFFALRPALDWLAAYEAGDIGGLAGASTEQRRLCEAVAQSVRWLREAVHGKGGTR